MVDILVCQNDCEKELEELTKELANCKVQLEAKQGAHMQTLLKQEHNQKMIQELSILLKKSDIERNKYMNECSEGRTYKDKLESKMKEIADLNLETAMFQDQLSHVLSELKATQRELLKKDTEIVAARDSELKALTNLEELETALKVEKEQKEELVHQVKELNEVIHRSKLAAIVNEEEMFAIVSERDQKIESATKATAQLQQQVEDMKEHIKMLKQDNEALFSTKVSGSNSINNLNIDMELKERQIMEQSVYIEKLEMELNQLKKGLSSAKEEMNGLNISNESFTSELKAINGRDVGAQVEIALLKSQLQEQRFAYKNGCDDDIQTEKAIQVENQFEISFMKKELENASAKIAEFRARAEQAISRAELAENGKAALEERIRRHKENRLRRKAALSALKEESTPKPFSPSTSYGTPGSYQPLGKVLNMRL